MKRAFLVVAALWVGCSSAKSFGPTATAASTWRRRCSSAATATPNLTSDKETGLGSWTDQQIKRAIVHGIDAL